MLISSHNYNPDVLTCIANLSNDEVFTPPKMANAILDLLPQELWSDSNATFLDPVSKSGVFLREIAKRLNEGLKVEMPDDQQRLNHIFKHQLFGIAITELTSLLSRRSVYCTKTANGKYSVCDSFNDEQGNIKFHRIEHTWKNGRCEFCGANQANYERGGELETHAYQFIHTESPEELFNMKFDVIVGNPPYQLSDGGFGASAKPIYHQFVEQAKKLNPRYLTMITPSRWFAGGRVGELNKFREEMLHDDRIRVIHDFISASDCFPGVEIKGGVNYFLWNRESRGKCMIYTHEGNDVLTVSERPLLEDGITTFIRHSGAIPVLRKVLGLGEDSFSKIVSANDPFGFDVRIKNSMRRIKPKFKKAPFEDSIPFYYNGWKKNGLGYIDKKYIRKNITWIDKHKLLVPKAVGSGDSKKDLIKPIFSEQVSCCSETYIVIGPFRTKQEMQNACSYLNTRFFHFMVALKKNTQEARRSVYQLVPMQDFSESWADEKLYKKYGLNEKEIAFIESMVRPMEINNE